MIIGQYATRKCTCPTAKVMPILLLGFVSCPKKAGCVIRITPATQTGMATYTALHSKRAFCMLMSFRNSCADKIYSMIGSRKQASSHQEWKHLCFLNQHFAFAFRRHRESRKSWQEGLAGGGNQAQHREAGNFQKMAGSSILGRAFLDDDWRCKSHYQGC